MFVSSHLMSEMALTAEHLIVVGRGRLIADTTTAEFLEQASGNVVLVRTPQADELRGHVARPGRDRRRARAGRARGARPDRAADRRDGRAAQHRPARADAAAGVARGGVHGSDARRRRVQDGAVDERGMRASLTRPDCPVPQGRVTQPRVVAVGVDEAALGPVDAVVARHRRASPRSASPRSRARSPRTTTRR